ncbi:MAG: GMC family oxidoreductase N-terminal domain-containing protein [bacterium]
MNITHAEDRMRILLLIWLVLFTAGFIVMGAAAWLPFGTQLYSNHPMLSFAWVSQGLLFLCSLFFLSGIRDNERAGMALFCFKIVSGTAMIVLLFSRADFNGSVLAVVGGGVLDYVMAGLTLAFLLMARRSRALRLSSDTNHEAGLERLPDILAAKLLRAGLYLFAAVFSAAAVGVLVAGLLWVSPQDAIFKIATGNAVAMYAALTYLCWLAAKTPRRPLYAQDIVVVVSFLATAAFIFFIIKFNLTGKIHLWFLIGASCHFIAGAAIWGLSILVDRALRPKVFWGPWLHRVFEQFCEVILKGDVEILTPREITDAAEDLLAKTPSTRLAGLKAALAFIEQGSSLFRFRAPMSRMGRIERERYLASVFQRGRGLFRDLIKIKQLVFLTYYTDERTQKEIGYIKFPEREKFKIAKDVLPSGKLSYPPAVDERELEADVCVIGSGAGGAVVAAGLAQAGKRVVILEEGPFLKRDRISDNELSMQSQAYRDGGLQLTVDFDMYVLQGRCVGGSTFVNNGVVFDLPDTAFKEWQDLGVSLNKKKLDQSFKRVRQQLAILPLKYAENLVEKGSFKFRQGCQELGLDSQWFELNMDSCIGAGNCTLGCPYEKKMSVERSFIPKALDADAILVSECKATKMSTNGSKVHTVECQRADGTPLTVKAEKVVVACGAIGSSLLLLRSGIKHNVGTRLCFNVGSWVFAEFPETIDSFDGIQMCAYHEHEDYFLETIAMLPGAFAAAMPGWFHEHFYNMRRYRHFAVAGSLVGSQPVGQVRPSRLPVLKDLISPIDFTLPISDLHKLKQGVKQVCNIFLKAGALRVIPATFQHAEFSHPAQIRRLDEIVLEPDDLSFGSAHPQGGNPMSDDEKLGVVDSEFRVHGFDNLYVCDSSVFPSSIKVNPQLTVMALADYAGEVIAKT